MSMKKNVLGLAAMAVAVSMASCSLEEVMEQPAQQAIGFSAFVGKSTKAATEIIMPNGAASDEQAALSKFYVFGKYGAKDGSSYDTEVYSNAEVTVTGDDFTNVGPTELKYWVADKDYKFAAYSDGNEPLTTTTEVFFDENGHITFTDYTAGEEDLILATAEETTGATIANAPNAVGLEFEHLLSQVAFEFVNGFDNGYQVKITELKFNVNNKATYFYQGSDYAWGTPTEPTDKEYMINSGNPFDGDQNSTQTSAYNFVIPQSNKGITASFTVTVYDTDGTTVVATKECTDVSLATGTTTTPGGDNNAWTPGYKYKYTATINADVLDDVMFPIKFKVTSVDTWKDAESNTDGDFGLDLDGSSN